MMEYARAEVLRYLGYREQALSEELLKLVEECMASCRESARPLTTWQVFRTEPGGGIRLPEAGLELTGRDIQAHLAQAEQVAVMAATLGAGTDSLIRRLEYTDLTRSVILDACATQYIEEICDRAEEEIRQKARTMGLEITSRYSPGYGDMGLEIQPELLELLQAQKRIGLTCTESLILLPRKSVTAFIGLIPPGTGMARSKGCAVCRLRDVCQFRKDGNEGGCNRTAAEQGGAL